MDVESLNSNKESASLRKELTKKLESPPIPGGEIPRFQLWSSKIDNNGREVGVKNPEGGFIKLNEGENFAVLRDFEKNRS